MTHTTQLKQAVREFILEPGGEVELLLTTNELRIRGIDGDRVIVRTRNGQDLDDEITIDAAPGHVRIQDGGVGELRLGPFRMRSRHPADLDVDVPRTAQVSVRTLSGAVDARGIGGESHWSSASGALSLQLEAGPVSIDTMSGNVAVDAAAALSVTARSMSGDVRIHAPQLDALRVETTSGNVSVEGALGASDAHAISSVSGDVLISTGSAIRLEAQTIAGDIRASTPHRADGGRGHRTIVVGDGGIALRVRTMSGDIVLRGRQDDPAPAVVSDVVASPGGPAAAPATGAWQGEMGSTEGRETARLAVLRALENGDLDVETAARRLEAIEDVGPVAGHGSR